MAIEQQRRAVGVFSERRDAELALRELRDSHFPMDKVSVITRDAARPEDLGGAEVRDRSGNKADEGATAGAVTGGTLGGLTGLLVGLGTLAIPGIGPIMLAGAAATTLATTLAGTAIGAATGGLLGGLIGLGIPEERAKVYNERVAQGHYLVLVEGTEEEVRRAEAILSNRGIEEWDVYHGHDTATATATATPGSGTRRRYRAIGVFPHRRDAEAALRELRDAGFPTNQLSLVGKDTPGTGGAGNLTDRTKTDEGAKAGAGTGAALGGLGGLLVGLGALAVPGIGPVIAGGALGTALATAAAGGAIGAAAGGITGALVGLGIPDERARFYNDRVNRGDYLVMAEGTEDEIARAEAIFRRHSVQDWDIFDVRDHDGAPHHDRTGSHRPDAADVAIGSTRQDTRAVDRTPANYAAAGSPRSALVHNKRAIGVFAHHRDAEAAVRELHQAGFPMSQVSLVGRDSQGGGNAMGGNVADRTKTDEGAATGAATGAALGGLGGLLVGLGALAIPGIGPVIAGGALATALTTAATGGAIGAAAGGLTGALVGLGIPDERARFYNDRINRGDYLVMVDGTEDEIRRAEGILSRRGIQDWGIFDIPDGDRHHTNTTTTATRHAIDPDPTPGVNTARGDYNVVSGEPEVIIVDRRDETL